MMAARSGSTPRSTASTSCDDSPPIPVLVSIPRIVTRSGTRRRRWRLALTAVSVVVCLALLLAGGHYFALGNEDIVRLMTRT